MEMDFWGSRAHSAKHHHFHAVQSGRFNNSDNHMMMETMEGDDDVRAWFPCPFCYVEIEIPVICVHLQEEHCFDLKNAVCPICAANLGKDAIGHFISHHSHSVKRRKSQKSALWNNDIRVVQEMSSLGQNRGNKYETAPDPLSEFLYNIPFSEPKNNTYQENYLPSDPASPTCDFKSKKSTPDEGEKEDYEEKMQRAAFVQQLIFSTIF